MTVFPVQRDGSLGEATDMKQARGSSVNRERQEGPHAHSIVLDPTNRFAYSCDLGTDKIMIFRFDARNGKLLPNEQPWVQTKPGAGPRHLAFYPGGKYVFVLSEMHSTVTAFTRDPEKGSLKEPANLDHPAEGLHGELECRYPRFPGWPVSLLFEPGSRQHRHLRD